MITVACKCGWCTDLELSSESNPRHCPQCGGTIMLTAMGEFSNQPLYVAGEHNPCLYEIVVEDTYWHPQDGWGISATDDGRFILLHPTNPDEVWDSFDELAEAYPICEVAREYFFGDEND